MGQRHQGEGVAVVQGMHAARECIVALGLDFNVHQDPVFRTVVKVNGDQLVGHAAGGEGKGIGPVWPSAGAAY